MLCVHNVVIIAQICTLAVCPPLLPLSLSPSFPPSLPPLLPPSLSLSLSPQTSLDFIGYVAKDPVHERGKVLVYIHGDDMV